MRNDDVPSKSVANVLSHSGSGIWFTVCRENGLGRSRQSFEPADHTFPIRMGRKAFDLFNVASDRDPFFIFGPLSHRPVPTPDGTGGLIADEYNSRISFGGSGSHGAGLANRYHAGRRDDDPSALHVVEAL